MKKELEDFLWSQIGDCSNCGKRLPRDVINEMVEKKMIQSPKQAWSTLTKWASKGVYAYGVCLDLGWKNKT